MTPLMVVLSSPSGGGKSTITRRLLEVRSDCGYSVSATTRSPRGGEQDGVAYRFLDDADFERRVDAGDFLEHAEYNGHRYGTLASEITRILHGGRHALLDIEVAGARQIRQQVPDAVLIFVVPPSGEALAERLRRRGTERGPVVTQRLRQAIEELGAATEYDYLVMNDRLDDAVALISAIMDAESHRTTRQRNFAVVLERLRGEVAAELARASGAS